MKEVYLHYHKKHLELLYSREIQKSVKKSILLNKKYDKGFYQTKNGETVFLFEEGLSQDIKSIEDILDKQLSKKELLEGCFWKLEDNVYSFSPTYTKLEESVY